MAMRCMCAITKKKKGDQTFRPIVTDFDDDFAVIDNLEDKLLIVTNRNAPNRKVVLVDPDAPEEKKLEDDFA